MEYVIAPLDKGDSLQVTPLSAPGENAFTAREIDYVERNAALEVLRPIEAVLLPIVRESFDNANFQSGDLHWWPYEGPPGMKETLRELKLQLYFNPGRKDGDFHLLDMLPLALIVNTTSQTPNDWNTYDYYYLNQGPFGSAQDLLQAYNRGSIRKIKLPSGYRDTVAKRYYTGRDDSKPLRANAFMPPPRTYEPKGPRYTIKGHTVGWMGWSFDVTTRMTRGPALFDVKFQNKRVSYEISLNEIALIYGSDSFERENVFYTDAIYGIGYYSGTIPGVDCPEHGHLLDTSYYDAKTGQAVTTKSICIFESDGEGPLWRRMANGYQSGLRDTCLVVRVAATIGNYDYVVEFHFKLDGKLATKVKATGQIATSFWDADNPNHGNLSTDDSPSARDPFGFRVGDFSHGIIHDHLFGFKVDLDVVDTNNSFEIIHFKSGEVADAFRQINPSITTKPKYFRYNQTRYIEYETVQIESGFRVNPMEPKYWTVVNGNHRNKWGAKRGYAIVPMATATQTMVDAHPAMNAISFTKYNCAVTKHKESERFLNSLFDAFRMYNTKGDFSTLLNGEGIVNEDIVNWVTVGFVHVPSSEDMPTTTAVETGFILKPFNFFDTTEVYDMPQVYSGNDGDVQKPPEFTPCLENK
ncbi:amiloride-sensitive amine oxidase [copper-containing]-like [Dreissena polymorpha]|nr:amiloride-sensitive amine oxidase [copper-containing]-like [Dreissena polymorpha]